MSNKEDVRAKLNKKYQEMILNVSGLFFIPLIWYVGPEQFSLGLMFALIGTFLLSYRLLINVQKQVPHLWIMWNDDTIEVLREGAHTVLTTYNHLMALAIVMSMGYGVGGILEYLGWYTAVFDTQSIIVLVCYGVSAMTLPLFYLKYHLLKKQMLWLRAKVIEVGTTV